MSGNQDGDWAWETSRTTGYRYPDETHLRDETQLPDGGRTLVMVPPRPRRWPWGPFKTAITGAVIVTAAGITLAVLTAPGGAPAPAAAETTTAATAIAATIGALVPTIPVPPDPYRALGDRLVGYDINAGQIPPGTYHVRVTGEFGYWARCSNSTCEINGGLSGLIDNRYIAAHAAIVPDLVIEPTDYLVHLVGIELVPA